MNLKIQKSITVWMVLLGAFTMLSGQMNSDLIVKNLWDIVFHI